MKLWVDDCRPAPSGYVWCSSVDTAKRIIIEAEMAEVKLNIEVIDLDHDAGEFACMGGDYIKLLDWLEATNRNYPIRIHSQNPIGVENMRRIIRKNGWKEVY